MLDALGADQRIGDLAHRRRLTANDQNFEAMVVIEMNVQRGKNDVMKIVLNVGELFVQISHVVVIDQRNRANHAAVGGFPHFFHELVADQIAKGLRPVGIAALSDQMIELIQEVGIDGNSNPAEAAHAYTY